MARRKGTGTLAKKGGVWEARWTVNGHRFSRSTGESSRRKAEKKLAELVAPFHAGDEAATLAALAAKIEGVRAGVRQAALPLSRLWLAYEIDCNRTPVSSSTLEHYGERVGVFVRWMAERFPEVVEVRGVTSGHAAEFMREIAAAKSPKTHNDYRAILAQVWDGLAARDRAWDAAVRYRFEEDWRRLRSFVEGNPWKDVKPLPKDTRGRRELTVEELARVAGAVSGEMRVLFAVGIYTGLREGDAAQLDWGAVDLVRGFIDATPRKTARHGTRVRIPIAPGLRGVLEEIPPNRRSGPVMPGLAEEYRNHRDTLVTRVQAVFQRCGIETQAEGVPGGPRRVVVGFHSLRHTFVSLCANGGVPLAVVQSIVGHTNAAMTRHYFHVADDALRGAAAVLPDVVTPEAVAESRASALRPVGAGNVPESHSGASGGILGEFSALVARMSDDERAEALRLLRAAMGAAG